MAYLIFLKYWDRLEDFRKILMSKFFLNLLVQISKALVYSKNQFLIRKDFFSTFSPIGPAASRPIRPFGPHAPADRLLPPPTPEQSAQAATTSRPRAAPMVGPYYLHQRENNCRITPPSFPH
jgi:hypothetical protein